MSSLFQKILDLTKSKKVSEVDLNHISMVHKADGVPCNQGAVVEMYKSFDNKINKSFIELVKSFYELEKSTEIDAEEKKTIKTESLNKYLEKFEKLFKNENFIKYLENNNQKEEIDMEKEELVQLFKSAMTDSLKPLTDKFEDLSKEVETLKKGTEQKPEIVPPVVPPITPEPVTKSEKEIELEGFQAEIEKAKRETLEQNEEYKKAKEQITAIEKQALQENPQIQELESKIEKMTKSSEDFNLEILKALKDSTINTNEILKSVLNNQLSLEERMSKLNEVTKASNRKLPQAIVKSNSDDKDDCWDGSLFN